MEFCTHHTVKPRVLNESLLSFQSNHTITLRVWWLSWGQCQNNLISPINEWGHFPVTQRLIRNSGEHLTKYIFIEFLRVSKEERNVQNNIHATRPQNMSGKSVYFIVNFWNKMNSVTLAPKVEIVFKSNINVRKHILHSNSFNTFADVYTKVESVPRGRRRRFTWIVSTKVLIITQICT